MNSSEWSLLFFTLIGQFSAGVTLALFFTITFSKKSFQLKTPILFNGLKVASISIIIALIVSFLHLSAPLSSYFALSNLKQSWLSREILMVSAYAAFIIFVALFEWKIKNKSLRKPLLFISGMLGLAMVYSMGKLYMIETVPVWNTPETLIVFYINTIVLGLSFMLSFYSNKIYDKVENIFILIILFTLILKLVTYYINWVNEVYGPIAFLDQHIQAIWNVLWWIWIPGFAIITGIYLKKNLKVKIKSRLYLFAFIFFVIAEIAARVIFYSSYYRLGI
ncbi:MAG: dimethyl sulfoxide reductase anchor subunit family protein [Thiohalospira sp.]